MPGPYWDSDQVHIYQEQSRTIIIVSNRLLMVIFTLQTRKEKKKRKKEVTLIQQMQCPLWGCTSTYISIINI